ncbi:hypothetical protein EDD86DRAFT_216724 [Gorgonomyces haynaldii]|nr:hypothetical protein EDD86DRAFT_216724 [Gorgonomyces haynaldii]
MKISYPLEAQKVILTGSFDNWSQSIELKKTENGFVGEITLDHSEQILFKFIVDGQWVTSPFYPTQKDDNGNVNNYINYEVEPKPVQEKKVAVEEQKHEGVAVVVEGVAPETVVSEPQVASASEDADKPDSVSGELVSPPAVASPPDAPVVVSQADAPAVDVQVEVPAEVESSEPNTVEPTAVEPVTVETKKETIVETVKTTVIGSIEKISLPDQVKAPVVQEIKQQVEVVAKQAEEQTPVIQQKVEEAVKATVQAGADLVKIPVSEDIKQQAADAVKSVDAVKITDAIKEKAKEAVNTTPAPQQKQQTDITLTSAPKQASPKKKSSIKNFVDLLILVQAHLLEKRKDSCLDFN